MLNTAGALGATGALPAAAQRDSLGCVLGRLDVDQELAGADATFFRKRKNAATPSQVVTPASDRGYLVGVSLQAGHQRRILRGNRSSAHDFDVGSVYVRDFAEDYRADLTNPFDFVLVEVPRSAFERAAGERDGPLAQGLSCVTGMHDPVLAHLALAMAAALQQPTQASPLFVDQMGVAMTTHLIDRYGNGVAAQAKPARVLSKLHESRAKEMLRSRLNGAVSIGEIAQACNLSRSYFIRAFRETTGHTPLQWLHGQRMAAARGLLLESACTLAEIASACGFADQSHFTRAFTQAEGMPPGQWRRQVGAHPLD